MDQPIDPAGRPPVDPQQPGAALPPMPQSAAPSAAPAAPAGQAPTPAPSEPPPGAYPYAPAAPPMPPTPILAPVVPTPAEKPKGRGSRVLNVVLGVALVVAIGGLAFAVGRMTAPASANAAGRFGNGQFPGFGNGENGNGGGFGNGGAGGGQGGAGGFLGAGGVTISGNVTAVTSDSITLDINGRSVTIPLDSSTTYQKASGATQSDVTVGSSVSVQLSGRLGFRGPNASPGASGGNGGTTGGPTLGPATSVTVNAQ